MSSIVRNSYSHTHHFVSTEEFNSYIDGLLTSDEMISEKKEKLQSLMAKDVWPQIQQSNYWRHNIVNRGLSGPFTEYFARFDVSWKVDFWGAKIQPIDIIYLSQNA